MPFLDPNKLAAKEMQANTIKPSKEPATLGSPPAPLTHCPSLVFSFVKTASKWYVDAKLGPGKRC